MALKLPVDVLIKRDEIINWNLKEKRKFVDITHDGQGRICNVYLTKKNQYEFEPV